MVLCTTCYQMLRGQDGRQWKGTYDLHFKHHDKASQLEHEAENCGICRVIHEELISKLGEHMISDEKDLTITACLSVLNHLRPNELYRLDFKVRYGSIKIQSTFVLNATSPDDPVFLTPRSTSTASDEVFQLAYQWIAKCTCAEHPTEWYPTRLIDLSELKGRDYLDTKRLISIGQLDGTKLEKTKVKLVETKTWKNGVPDQVHARYVTLSHRWGSSPERQLQLTTNTMASFIEGIQLRDLPQTFRDAIEFASRIPQVGYIWIDSLCIKQGPSSEERNDWLAEAAMMGKVYKDSFLNLSATASENSTEGLFRNRQPKHLLEDEVKVNIDGIPGAKVKRANTGRGQTGSTAHFKQSSPSILRIGTLSAPSRAGSTSRSSQLLDRIFSLVKWLCFTWLSKLISLLHGSPQGFPKLQHKHQSSIDSDSSLIEMDELPSKSLNRRHTDDNSQSADYTETKSLQRCTILDVSFWKTHVGNAPVNKRGWVLQERLLAPRVLHFCYNQIAWECREWDAAEERPRGVPNFQLTSSGIVEESHIKGLDDEDGKALREMRLKGYDEPDPHLCPQIYAFELWRRIVEVYSKTALTKSEDKLIALSGIAELMAGKIAVESKQPAIYIAGLWANHLESQLLWKVDPMFNELNNSFSNPSTRPKADQYRAPTFSWASLDAERGNGVVYGEVTDRDLFIEVKEVQAIPMPGNKYGVVTEAHLLLWGHLRKIRLTRKDKGRYSWHTVGRDEKMDTEEHMNVYLDCPNEDAIFDTDDIYCVPAAEGDRTETRESKYLVCLILQLVTDGEEPIFQRVGLTKLSPWADKFTRHHLLKRLPNDMDMPHRAFDEVKGRNLICII